MNNVAEWFTPCLLMQDLIGAEESVGLARVTGSASKMAHSYSCWKETSIPCNRGLFTGLLCVLMTQQLIFSRLNDPKESKRGRCYNFHYDLTS